MAHYNYSKRAIVLTADKRVDLMLKTSLAKVGVEIVKDIPNLSSLTTIGRVLKSVKGAGFFRAELFNFIQTHGFPHLVVMDLRLDLGLDDSNDHGKIKLLKTILISYIIFSMGRGFEKLHLNLLLIYSEEDTPTAEALKEKTSKLLSLIHTKNQSVNDLIEAMKKDEALFKKIFTINFIPRSDMDHTIETEITRINMVIETRQKVADKLLDKNLGSVSNSEKLPADVYFKGNTTLYCNGEKSEVTENPYLGAEAGALYIEGYWTSNTGKQVSTRIKRCINQAITDLEFKKKDQLIIHLQEKCLIDGTIAASLANLIIQDLVIQHPSIIVEVSRFNEPIMRKSQGFGMVKEYLTFETT